MTMKRLNFLALAVAGFAFACADPSGPTRTLLPSDVALGVLAPEPIVFASWPAGVGAGDVILCKTATAPGGTFGFTVVSPSGTTNPTITVGAAGGTVCAVAAVYTSAIDNAAGAELVSITEDADQTNWTLDNIDVRRIVLPIIYNNPSPPGGYTSPRLDDNIVNRTANVYINDDMARVVTFENSFTAPPSTGCTYTKGWYRNNGSSTVIAVDSRTIAEAQAIFKATPGKPGGVTFGGDNTLLNLYQQLLAALNNLGGDANEDDGPDAVDAAIDAAQDGTGGTGLNITTTLSQTEMSALIATLAAFNEGTFTGWPHCDDN